MKNKVKVLIDNISKKEWNDEIFKLLMAFRQRKF